MRLDNSEERQRWLNDEDLLKQLSDVNNAYAPPMKSAHEQIDGLIKLRKYNMETIEDKYQKQITSASKPRAKMTIDRINDSYMLDDEMDLDVITKLVQKKRHYDSRLKEYQNSRNLAASEIRITSSKRKTSLEPTVLSFLRQKPSVERRPMSILQKGTLNYASNESLPSLGTLLSKR